MAQIVDNGGGGKKGGKKRPKKGSTNVDMTPMVDLAFLLLTFFVMTSTFSKPKVMSLVYPAKKPIEQPPSIDQEINNAITFLLTEDKIFYYENQFRTEPGDGMPATTLSETTFGPQGVRKLLADKNNYVLKEKMKLDEQLRNKEIADSTYTRLLIVAKKNKQALKVLIKTDMEATCKNFIDLIDELKINDIGVIAPVDIMVSEEKLLKEKIGN